MHAVSDLADLPVRRIQLSLCVDLQEMTEMLVRVIFCDATLVTCMGVDESIEFILPDCEESPPASQHQRLYFILKLALPRVRIVFAGGITYKASTRCSLGDEHRTTHHAPVCQRHKTSGQLQQPTCR
jgi:hypothetical protein